MVFDPTVAHRAAKALSECDKRKSQLLGDMNRIISMAQQAQLMSGESALRQALVNIQQSAYEAAYPKE